MWLSRRALTLAGATLCLGCNALNIVVRAPHGREIPPARVASVAEQQEAWPDDHGEPMSFVNAASVADADDQVRAKEQATASRGRRSSDGDIR